MTTVAKLTRINRQVTNLKPQDVGALPAGSQAKDAALFDGKTHAQIVAESRAHLVNETRKVNGHALTADIKLTPADVGASPLGHTHDYIPNSLKAKANGIATLDGSGKIPQSQVPAIAIKETFVVASEKEMLALNVQMGDLAIRSDLRRTFVLMKSPATDVKNWQEFLTPTDQVASVNGERGVVTLNYASVGAEQAFAKHTAFNKNFGTTEGTVVQGNDTRVVHAVQISRTINGHALNADITLSPADVGALAAKAQAVDSKLFDGKTHADIIAEARKNLATAGVSYSKAESDGKYETKAGLEDSLKDLIRTVDVVVPTQSATVTLPANSVGTVLTLSVSGALQNKDAYTLSGTTLKFCEELLEGDIVTVIGFK